MRTSLDHLPQAKRDRLAKPALIDELVAVAEAQVSDFRAAAQKAEALAVAIAEPK